MFTSVTRASINTNDIFSITWTAAFGTCTAVFKASEQFRTTTCFAFSCKVYITEKLICNAILSHLTYGQFSSTLESDFWSLILKAQVLIEKMKNWSNIFWKKNANSWHHYKVWSQSCVIFLTVGSHLIDMHIP